MKIKIERSGGFGGITTTHEMNVEDLPRELKSTVTGLLATSNSITSSKVPKGAADQFEYKVTIQDGIKERVMHYNEYSLQNNVRSLIKYLERK